MKKLLLILFLLISSIITYSQGVGYLNYSIYNISRNGAGQFANSATDFVNMFDLTKGATLYSSGVSTANNLLYFNGGFFTSVPNGGNYFGVQSTGYFIPTQTGTYQFGIDGDDGVDFSLNGNVVTSFYGGHGFNGYRIGSINLVKGQVYTFRARFQQWGGGWGMYLIWSKPDGSGWGVHSDEVTSIVSTPTKKGFVDFNFNTNVDATKFSVGSTLNTAGQSDITTLLDSVKISNGYKVGITAGQTEWSYVNIYNGSTTLYIDLREFGNTTPSTVNSVSILDVYNGPVTYLSSDIYWAQYSIPSTLPKVTDGSSTYNSNIRNAGYSNYAFSCNVGFTANQIYKPQTISVSTTNNLTTLYNSIVTVSDVYQAFQEYSNQGLFGNQTGTSFTYGIQYQNADIDGNGVFDENDCFLLLQNLTGAKPLVDTFNLNKTLRIIPQSTYDMIGKSNWNTFTNPLGSSYTFDINTGKSTDTLNLAVAWKGDVNLSHSTTPVSNNYTTMAVKSMSVSNQINASILTEIVGDSVYAYITIDPLGQNLMGVQFQLNYDNSMLKYNKVKFITKGSPTNWGIDNSGFIGLGSIITGGSSLLDNTTQYIISFSTNTKLDNILGLISIGATDAVNQNGTQLKVVVN